MLFAFTLTMIGFSAYLEAVGKLTIAEALTVCLLTLIFSEVAKPKKNTVIVLRGEK